MPQSLWQWEASFSLPLCHCKLLSPPSQDPAKEKMPPGMLSHFMNPKFSVS